jgi:hypothetical protein
MKNKGTAALSGCIAVLLLANPNLAFAQAKAKAPAKKAATPAAAPIDPVKEVQALGDTIIQTCSVVTDAGGTGANPTIKKVLSDLIDKAVAKGTTAIGASGVTPDAQKTILQVISNAGVAKQFLAGDKEAPNCVATKTTPTQSSAAATGEAAKPDTTKPDPATPTSDILKFAYTPKLEPGQFRATADTCGFHSVPDDGNNYCAPLGSTADIMKVDNSGSKPVYPVKFYDNKKTPLVDSTDLKKIDETKRGSAETYNIRTAEYFTKWATEHNVVSLKTAKEEKAQQKADPAQSNQNSPPTDNKPKNVLVEPGQPYTIAALDFDKSWNQRFGWTAGLITIPIKAYGGKNIEANVSAGAYLGYRNPQSMCLGAIYCPDPTSAGGRFWDGLDITPVFVAAGTTVGSGSLRSTGSSNTTTTTGTGAGATTTSTATTPSTNGTTVGYSLAGGFVFNLKDDSSFHIGALMGWDYVDAGNAAKFKYQGKPWYSVSVGYSFKN